MCDCTPTPAWHGRGVDLEIFESPSIKSVHPDANGWIPIKPTRLKINGVEVLVPDEAPVVIEGLVDKRNCAKVTMTVFVRSLKVHGGDE